MVDLGEIRKTPRATHEREIDEMMTGERRKG